MRFDSLDELGRGVQAERQLGRVRHCGRRARRSRTRDAVAVLVQAPQAGRTSDGRERLVELWVAPRARCPVGADAAAATAAAAACTAAPQSVVERAHVQRRKGLVGIQLEARSASPAATAAAAAVQQLLDRVDDVVARHRAVEPLLRLRCGHREGDERRGGRRRRGRWRRRRAPPRVRHNGQACKGRTELPLEVRGKRHAAAARRPRQDEAALAGHGRVGGRGAPPAASGGEARRQAPFERARPRRQQLGPRALHRHPRRRRSPVRAPTVACKPTVAATAAATRHRCEGRVVELAWVVVLRRRRRSRRREERGRLERRHSGRRKAEGGGAGACIGGQPCRSIPAPTPASRRRLLKVHA